MSYDYTGIRVKKSGSSGTIYFPFTGYEVNGSAVTEYIRMGDEIVAAIKDGNKLFYHNDHLGGVNVVSDAYGVQQRNEYDPWGNVSKSEGSVDPTHRFTGQELDPESNIHYYVGRYYDQGLGRFISADPFVQDPDNPQNLNRYSYVLNGPQTYIDPSGYFWDDSDYGSSDWGGSDIYFTDLYLVRDASFFSVNNMMASYAQVDAFQQSQSWGNWSVSSDFLPLGFGSGTFYGSGAGSSMFASASNAPNSTRSATGNRNGGSIKIEASIGPQMSIRAGTFRATANFGSMGTNSAGQNFVKQEFALAMDFGRGFLGFSASRQILGRINSTADYWTLQRQLQQQAYTWKLVRQPWEASTEGVTVGLGYALPMIPSVNIEVDIFQLGREIFNDITNNFAVTPAPRR
jgi:RHS repeat-associated protein